MQDFGQQWKKRLVWFVVCEQYKTWLSIRVNYHNGVILIVTLTQERKSHSMHPEWNALEGDVSWQAVQLSVWPRVFSC